MLCEMPVDLRCKIDSSLSLALVLRNSESCRAFCQAMHDDSLWELLLRRDFPHYTPSEASSGSWCTEYQHQVCLCGLSGMRTSRVANANVHQCSSCVSDSICIAVDG